MTDSPTADVHLDDNRLIAERRAKLAALRAQGVAFPNDFRRTHFAGDLQREFERERAAMNDAIGAITQQHQPKLSDLQQRIEALQGGVQAWCEAHRTELCGEGDKLGFHGGAPETGNGARSLCRARRSCQPKLS